MDVSKLTDRLAELQDQTLSYYQGSRLIKVSYPQMCADVYAALDRLELLGVERGMRVGLISENSYQWIVYDLALLRLGCVTVCIPPTEFANVSTDEMAEQYRLNLLFMSAKERSRRPESFDWIVGLEQIDDPAVAALRKVNSSAERNGHERSLEPGVMSLAFSSGTAGKLKCLQISKQGTEEWLRAFGHNYAFKPDDRMLVILPLCNFQQRLMVYTAICFGFNLLLADPAQMFRALKEMQPTILIGPPAFYEVAENRFRNLPPRKRFLLSSVASIIGLIPFRRWRSALLQRWLKPFYEAFGGKMRLMLTGMAPCKRSTLDLFALLGLPLFQVYGLTETGLITWNLPGRNRIGSVGKPVREGSVEIADDGEIIVHSKNPLALRYLYCSEEEEKKTFRGYGEIATGDIGRCDKDGYYYIVGRKKEIIVTQGGYKVQPEQLETVLEELPEVSRAVVLGGGDLPGLVAIVSLRVGGNSEVQKKSVSLAVERLNTRQHSAARICQVIFTDVQFSTANGFLTSNLKIDRRAIYQSFKNGLLEVA